MLYADAICDLGNRQSLALTESLRELTWMMLEEGLERSARLESARIKRVRLRRWPFAGVPLTLGAVGGAHALSA